MEKLKIAERISKRLNVPFYVGRYQTGAPLIGYGHEWFIFFKERDLPTCAFRFWRRFPIGFKQNESFGIMETHLSSFKPCSGYRICYQCGAGTVYTQTK